MSSGLTPYRKNTITLDTQTIPGDVDITDNIISDVYPTKGAVILADFKIKRGFKILFTVKNSTGLNIPMGANALMEDGEQYIFSNVDQLYAITDREQGNINVNWTHDGNKQQCTVPYNISSVLPVNGIYLLTATCVNK